MSEGGGFGVAAAAVLQMGQSMAGGRDPDGDGRARLFNQLHQVPVGPAQIPITAGAGVLQLNDLFSVRAGFMWSIRRLAFSGFSAGTVVAYKGGAVVGGAYTGGGEPMIPASAAGVFTVGRGEGLLDQGDALVFVCTGITVSAGFAGVQVNGAADCFERWLLPDYLGLGQK